MVRHPAVPGRHPAVPESHPAVPESHPAMERLLVCHSFGVLSLGWTYPVVSQAAVPAFFARGMVLLISAVSGAPVHGTVVLADSAPDYLSLSFYFCMIFR